jgi:hypothetical protein
MQTSRPLQLINSQTNVKTFPENENTHSFKLTLIYIFHSPFSKQKQANSLPVPTHFQLKFISKYYQKQPKINSFSHPKEIKTEPEKRVGSRTLARKRN